MAAIQKMSAAKLASLKHGPTINILFRENDTTDLAMLREGFPKQVATTFSALCRQTFPALAGTSMADISKSPANSVTIIGGRVDAHKAVLSWMLACCEGRGMRPFPYIHRRRFWHYAHALESAEILQIDILCEELWGRMKDIAKLQVHTEDIHAVYSTTEKGYPIRGMIAESIGRALLERRLAARPAYNMLRQDPQLKDFDEDVNQAIARLKKEYAESEQGRAARAEHQAARKAAKEAAQQRFQRRRNNPQKMTTAEVAQHLDVPTESVKSEDDGTFKVTVSTEIIRKGRNGRGQYVALPLRQAGVTAEAYRPAVSEAAPPIAKRATAEKPTERRMHGHKAVPNTTNSQT
ncbi:hypothetical protein EPUS_05715 [Endocarpon pusillum Z07020]|uniref:Uncharacterized protein n=1 Tax=Endocarpon pusillum (strain Z07020 / HMAS-L-300199) TaxID=1263415 RepID=U1GLB9_ENDPU|nr:uncharacterized protein EPUS_05715 [Endocarpon pusillum Z07020]ERF72661.1 hypothetical protein EPUS_05715 [Endocarpon pusillum Z07020]